MYARSVRRGQFVGNDDAGEVNAAFVSLLASCQLHGIEPWSYLRDRFCLLSGWSRSRVLELAPAHWRQTLGRPDMQQQLDAHIYRHASLGPSPGHCDRRGSLTRIGNGSTLLPTIRDAVRRTATPIRTALRGG